jgi:flagellar assembly protein FliH
MNRVVEKFLFTDDFDSDPRSASRRRGVDEQALAAAEQNGFARGVLDGRRQVEQESAHRMAVAIEQVAQTAQAVLAHIENETPRFEQEAALLAMAFARKLAGDLIAREPLAQLEAAAADCFRHILGAPHVAIRVADNLVDVAKTTLDRLAADRGFAGKLIVIGEPDMPLGDFRLEWADGGMARNEARLNDLMSSAIARHTGATPSQSPQ